MLNNIPIVNKLSKDYSKKNISEILDSEGLIVIQNTSVESNEEIISLAQMVGLTELNIDEDLSGPQVMIIKKDPNKIKPNQASTYFTSDFFPLHTDLSYVINPPKYLLMQCVVEDTNGEGVSLLSDCSKSFNILSSHSKQNLMQQKFIFPNPPNCKIGENIFPIYSINDKVFRLKNETMKCPKEFQPALTEFIEVLKNNIVRYLLKKGDTIIIDNHRLVHGRTSFQSETRKLRRIYSAERKSCL